MITKNSENRRINCRITYGVLSCHHPGLFLQFIELFNTLMILIFVFHFAFSPVEKMNHLLLNLDFERFTLCRSSGDSYNTPAFPKEMSNISLRCLNYRLMNSHPCLQNLENRSLENGVKWKYGKVGVNSFGNT